MPDAPPTPTCDRAELSSAIKREAERLGFDMAGIAPAVTPTGFKRLHEWLQRGYAGEMAYLERREAAYEHPGSVLAGVKSVIVLAVNYHTRPRPPAEPNSGLVARYAWGSTDYHDRLRARLKGLAAFLHRHRPGCRTRGVVDTAPVLERDFAVLSGLGWIAKNTMLINRRMGSWLFLAALLTDVELDCDEPHETSHCGTCTRCLEACPTGAFPEPYVLDARRCISYLTIELRDQPIPADLRPGMGQWLFGCDICQDVCPWNHDAPRTKDDGFLPLDDLAPADAAGLLRLTPEQFEARFQHSPLSRPKRSGLLRNAAIVLGNSGDRQAIPALIAVLDDEEPLVRGAAAWALGQLGGVETQQTLEARLAAEVLPEVTEEIRSALVTLAAGIGG